MKPFFDFNNLSAADKNQLEGQLRNSVGQSASNDALQPILERFMAFIQERIIAIRNRITAQYKIDEIGQMALNFDPLADPDRFLCETWDHHAPFWALIETYQTYYATMRNILRKLELHPDNHCNLVSLGSGPGLYETFLARQFDTKGIGGMITCVDFSKEMTETQKFILSLEHPPLRNIETVTSDMTSIPLPDHRSDAVICNNSLQWCRQWKKAISEMARILDADRVGMAYLVIHVHDHPMGLISPGGNCPIKMPYISAESIMDELETNMFTILGSVQMRGSKGSGQAGGTVDRVMIQAKYTPQRLLHQWRRAQRTAGEARIMRWSKK